MYTGGVKVTDYNNLISKSDVFNSDIYQGTTLNQHAKFFPGFVLSEIPGAPLRVLGVLNARTSVEEVECIAQNPSRFADEFFQHVLTPAFRSMPQETRTRKNNLALEFLPSYFRVYPEDLPILSTHIKSAVRSLPEDKPYRHYFMYCKYGQQFSLSNLGFLGNNYYYGT